MKDTRSAQARGSAASALPGDLVEYAENFWPENDWGLGFVIGVNETHAWVLWSGTHRRLDRHELDDLWIRT